MHTLKVIVVLSHSNFYTEINKQVFKRTTLEELYQEVAKIHKQYEGRYIAYSMHMDGLEIYSTIKELERL